MSAFRFGWRIGAAGAALPLVLFLLFVLQPSPASYISQGGSGGAASERYSWALCSNVDCQTGTALGNAVLVTGGYTLSACYAKAKTAPVGADIRIVIRRNGSGNVFGSPAYLAIPSGSTAVVKTTSFSASGSLADLDYLTVDIDQIGSSTAGKDVSVTCIGN